MKKTVFILAGAIMFFMVGCQNQGKKVTEKDVKKAEEALFNEDMSTNKDAVPNAVATFIQYAEENAEEANAPEYLFKAFEISVNAKQDAQQSIDLCNRLLTNYPEFDKNPVALFMLASYVYDEQMHDLDKARETYQRVVDQYPNSPFANDAAIAITQLGMSLDELIKMFESKGE